MAEVTTYEINGEEAQEFSDFFQEHVFKTDCPQCKRSVKMNLQMDKPVWEAFMKLLDGFAKKVHRIGRESRK